MSVLRSLRTAVAAHPVLVVALAFALGSLLSSVNLLGALLGLFIHALNLAWLVVGGFVMVATVWLICLSFERKPQAH